MCAGTIVVLACLVVAASSMVSWVAFAYHRREKRTDSVDFVVGLVHFAVLFSTLVLALFLCQVI